MKEKIGFSPQDMHLNQHNKSAELGVELRSDLQVLFETFSGSELADAVIGRIHRSVVDSANQSGDNDFQDIGGNELKGIQETIQKYLTQLISRFISDTHREFVVRCHARGVLTAKAVGELMEEDATMGRFAQEDALGVKKLRDILIHRLSYLKPGTARWPEKKYGAVWREARDEYKRMINDMPLTSSTEQVALLAKHAERIDSALGSNDYTVKDLEMLTNSLTKTLESLQKFSAGVAQTATDLSAPQLVAVLERLTVALDTPEQLALSGDTDAVLSVLEQLTLALKDPGQKALGEESVQEAEGGDNSGDSA